MGDIIHTIPAVSALRKSLPGAQIDWLVDRRFRDVLSEVAGLDRILPVDLTRAFQQDDGILGCIRSMRRYRYDLVVDFQGLLKSALFARFSGGRQVLGFSMHFAREPLASLMYSKTYSPASLGHVILKNLQLVMQTGVEGIEINHCWKQRTVSPVKGASPYAVLIPGASWPHKRWPAELYGELASIIEETWSIRSILIHGSDEEQELAVRGAAASGGAATVSDHLSFRNLRLLLESASIVIGADTGPLHLSWSLGTAGVGLFGPTNPECNGPWTDRGASVSRFGECQCRYKRHCSLKTPCITSIAVEDVLQVIRKRHMLEPAGR